MKPFFVALIVLFSLSSFAKSQNVMVITNDIDSNIVSISINDESDQFKGIYQVEKTPKGDILKEASFSLEQLFNGTTVHVKHGREVVKIRFNRNFDSAYGGTFVLEYLANGITGSWKSVELGLHRNSSKWEVTMDSKLASKLHVVAKKALGKIIGISKIQTK